MEICLTELCNHEKILNSLGKLGQTFEKLLAVSDSKPGRPTELEACVRAGIVRVKITEGAGL